MTVPTLMLSSTTAQLLQVIILGHFKHRIGEAISVPLFQERWWLNEVTIIIMVGLDIFWSDIRTDARPTRFCHEKYSRLE